MAQGPALFCLLFPRGARCTLLVQWNQNTEGCLTAQENAARSALGPQLSVECPQVSGLGWQWEGPLATQLIPAGVDWQLTVPPPGEKIVQSLEN